MGRGLAFTLVGRKGRSLTGTAGAVTENVAYLALLGFAGVERGIVIAGAVHDFVHAFEPPALEGGIRWPKLRKVTSGESHVALWASCLRSRLGWQAQF